MHSTGQFKPFLSGSLGLGIFDLKEDGIGSDTRFSWSVGAGGKYMAKSNRVGAPVRRPSLGHAVPVG